MTIHAIQSRLFYGTLYIDRTAVSRNIKRHYRCSRLWKWYYARRGVECRPAVQSAIYLWRFLAGWWSDAVADADNCCGAWRWPDDLGARVVCLSTYAFHLLVAANCKHPVVSFRNHGAPSIQYNISFCYRIYHAPISVFWLIHLRLYLSTFVRAATAYTKRRSVELFCLLSFALFVVLTPTSFRRWQQKLQASVTEYSLTCTRQLKWVTWAQRLSPSKKFYIKNIGHNLGNLHAKRLRCPSYPNLPYPYCNG